jgi:hypothetical protein
MKLELELREVATKQLNPGDVYWYKNELYRVNSIDSDYNYVGTKDDFHRRDDREVFKVIGITATTITHYR